MSRGLDRMGSSPGGSILRLIKGRFVLVCDEYPPGSLVMVGCVFIVDL